jgi:lysophospholipase L1-like esterase
LKAALLFLLLRLFPQQCLVPDVLVADGDSITVGAGTPTPYSKQLTLTHSYLIFNTAVTGETLTTMYANAPTVVDPLFGTRRSVVVIWGGTNDLGDGTTAAVVYSTMQNYCAARQAKGWRCVIATMLSRVSLDARKNDLNNLIEANHSWADGLADFTGTALGCDGCYANSTYFQADGIHPVESAISSIEAPTISAAVNALP